MTFAGKLEAPVAGSGITLTDLNPQIALAAIQGLGMTGLINATMAQTLGTAVKCNDLVTGEDVVSSTQAPVLNTAINGRPTMTFGSGAAGITGQLIRTRRYGMMDLGTGAWSIGMLIRAMNTGSSDVIISPERIATMEAGHYSPYIRIAASGDKTLSPALFDNAGGLRTVCNTHEFYNANRLLLICGTPGVGIKWYVDDWSAPKVTSSTSASQQAFTDGKFLIGGYGPAISSLSFAGSIAVVSSHNVDLSANAPARRAYMKAVAAYGGITSN